MRTQFVWIGLGLAIAAAPQGLAAQGRVTGTVRDGQTGAPILGAQIQIVARRLRSVTDGDGRFQFAAVPPGSHVIRVARIGFTPAERELLVTDGDSTDLEFVLAAAAVRLSDIVVTPGRFGVMDAGVVAQQTLSREDIELIPQMGEDVFRAVKRLPGVASDDISTRLNVRGGTDQELLVLLDGMELYEPYHLKDFDGALGVVDINAIGGIDLVAGGFSAEHGDKLAGVYNMRSRTPPLNGARTSLGLSITNASLLSQGGFGNGNGQWLLSARRGYLDIALALTGSDDLSPEYWDVFGKAQYQLHPLHRLSVNVLHAEDGLRLRATDPNDNDGNLDSGWKSSYGWLTWQSQPLDRLSTRTMGFAGRVTRRRFGDVEDLGRARGPERATVDDDRVFNFAGAKVDMSYDVSDRVLFKLGGEIERTEADYAYFGTTRTLVLTPTSDVGARFDTVSVVTQPQATETSAYGAVRLQPVDVFTVELGLRYDGVSHTRDSDVAPRILAALDVTPATTLRASGGRYYQSHGVHELDVGDGEERFVPSERAQQVAVGVQHRLAGGVSARVEAYRRRTADLRPRYFNADREIDAFPETEGDRILIDAGRSESRGIELLVARDEGRRWAWSMSYVVAEARDEIDSSWAPRVLDQRHTLGLNIIYRPDHRWRVSAAFQYHTGWPATPSVFSLDTLASGSVFLTRELGPYNALRLPAYHRVDFRISRNFNLRQGVLQAYLDIFNLYNRANLRSYGYNVRVTDQAFVVNQVGGEELLPVLPSLGFRFEF